MAACARASRAFARRIRAAARTLAASRTRGARAAQHAHLGSQDVAHGYVARFAEPALCRVLSVHRRAPERLGLRRRIRARDARALQRVRRLLRLKGMFRRVVAHAVENAFAFENAFL
jgi:hypothetical protein